MSAMEHIGYSNLYAGNKRGWRTRVMQAPYRSLIFGSLTLILSHLTFHKFSKQYLRSIKVKKKTQRYGFVAIFTRSLTDFTSDFTLYAEISSLFDTVLFFTIDVNSWLLFYNLFTINGFYGFMIIYPLTVALNDSL